MMQQSHRAIELLLRRCRARDRELDLPQRVVLVLLCIRPDRSEHQRQDHTRGQKYSPKRIQ